MANRAIFPSPNLKYYTPRQREGTVKMVPKALNPMHLPSKD